MNSVYLIIFLSIFCGFGLLVEQSKTLDDLGNCD